MSVQADVLEGRTNVSAVKAYPAISPLQVVWWSIRRELWDNRSLYLAPAIVAGLVLLGFFVGPFGMRYIAFDSMVYRTGAPDVRNSGLTLDTPFQLVSGLVLTTSLLVGIFYTADCLFAERRDRSILFWKSLPVSDTEAVAAKASVPLLVLPAITCAVIAVAHLVMLVASSVALARLGMPVAPVWARLALPQMWLTLLVRLVTVVLWYAPFYGWLMLVSAYVTRAPLLWALLPPLGLALLEEIVFHTTAIGHALLTRLAHGGFMAWGVREPAGVVGVQDPALWIGLVVAVVFLAGAVQLRRAKSML